MDQLSLKTIIDYGLEEFNDSFNYNNPVYNLLLLKNGSILIYTTNNIIILNNSLQLKNLMSFNKDEVITSIKEFENRKIFCCVKKLYVLSIKSNTIINKEEILFKNNEIIYDVIKLKNGKIFGITNKSIVEIKENNYEIDELFKVPENWLFQSYKERYSFYSKFQQYINLYELPNNRLLIHSYSTEFLLSDCGTHPPEQMCFNRIYILNLTNFDIIHQFEEIEKEINIIILDKYICILHFFRNYKSLIDIYSLEDYKKIKRIEEERLRRQYMIKYDGNKFISLSIEEKLNNIILYDLSNINDIKYQLFKGKFIKFNFKFYNGVYKVRNAKNKSICILKDGSFFIICHGKIYIVEFPKSYDLLPLTE